MKKIFTKKVFLWLLIIGSSLGLNFSCSSSEDVSPKYIKKRILKDHNDEPEDPHKPDKPTS